MKKKKNKFDIIEIWIIFSFLLVTSEEVGEISPENESEYSSGMSKRNKHYMCVRVYMRMYMCVYVCLCYKNRYALYAEKEVTKVGQ